MKRKLFVALVCTLLLVTTVIAPIAQAAVVEVLRINVDGARLRSGPGNYPIITSLKKGTKVLYAGKMKNAFCLVRTSSGEQGYVYNKFLSTYGAVQSKQVFRTRSIAPVYKKPSTSAALAGFAYANQSVIIYEVRGKWAYVKSMSGKGGYIQTKYLAR